MLLWNNEHLPRSHWLNIHKSEYFIVLIDFARLKLSDYDLAKDTACHLFHSRTRVAAVKEKQVTGMQLGGRIAS